MKQPIFIRIETTFDEAMYSRTSPQMEFYSFKGVQLLPNNQYPYIQRTYAKNGIELENADEVLVYDMCGRVLDDMTPYFTITNVFQDSNTGLNQIEWKLKDIPLDFGDQLVYLRIRQGVNEFFYTSPFTLTEDGAEFTSRWDYKNHGDDTMLSTQLKIWFKQLSDLEEGISYDTLSGRRVNMNSKVIPYEVWQIDIVDINLFRLFKQLRQNSIVYCDLQKTVPFESFETPRLAGKENFAEAEILLSRDEDNTYNPLYVPITPTPDPEAPEITLVSIASLNNSQVSYTFTYANFVPSVLTLQYSIDNINWIDNTGGVVSPRVNNVPNHLTNNYYYRVYHYPTNTPSNVLQLTEPTLTITNMLDSGEFNPNGNKYRFFYTALNFTPTVQFSYECSVDGVTWQPMFYGNQLPVVAGIDYATTPASSEEFTYFRMKYNNPPLGIVSNVYEHTI